MSSTRATNQNECPTRKIVNVVEREEEGDGVDCEPDGDEEDEYGTGQGHALILTQIFV